MKNFNFLPRPVYRNFFGNPIYLLYLMAAAMPLSFAVWSALLNNFTVEIIGVDGGEIGWLHTVREVPGFLAVGVIAVLLLMREQTLAIISLLLLGAATAVTAWMPFLSGILFITLLSSVGFHYFETVNQSLQLQWLEKEEAPQKLGQILAVGSGTTLIAYLLLFIGWKYYNISFDFAYTIAGGATVIIAIFCFLCFPYFETPNRQRKKIILRKRYWLFYLLNFMAGARRQIFIVFAGFMMVEHFEFKVHEITTLYMINLFINIFAAPVIGRSIGRFGERKALLFEYSGLTLVFLAYGGIYFFGWGVILAVILFVLDHLLFSLAMAIKTYFQKIADPKDIAPTAAVAFTINHIAAVFLPALLGYIWLTSPALVFLTASVLATMSFALALLIPRNPREGKETILVGLFS